MSGKPGSKRTSSWKRGGSNQGEHEPTAGRYALHLVFLQWLLSACPSVTTLHTLCLSPLPDDTGPILLFLVTSFLLQNWALGVGRGHLGFAMAVCWPFPWMWPPCTLSWSPSRKWRFSSFPFSYGSLRDTDVLQDIFYCSLLWVNRLEMKMT